MKLVRTIDAVGQVLCHDITRIVRGEVKEAVFRKGHIVTLEDIEVLLDVGKEHIYIWENDDTMLHENEAAEILYAMTADLHMHPTAVKEGKIEAIADVTGLLKVNSNLLKEINSMGRLMIATRHGNTVVHAGDKLAGMRIIPLVIEKETMENAKTLCEEETVLQILPFVKKKAAVISTGSEVYTGRIKDTFTPVIVDKLKEFSCEVIYHQVCNDDPQMITDAILEAVKQGAEIVLCTGGMSVDPDDRTPLAIKNTGARIISYGAPVLPGAMFLLSYLETGHGVIPVCGLPGCVMYSERTIFDLVLPRLLAEDPVTADELSSLGEGGLCLGCRICTYPDCGFGKGW